MKHFIQIIIIGLGTIFCSSCSSFKTFGEREWEMALRNQVSEADTVEISIPYYFLEKEVYHDPKDIQRVLDMIRIDESKSIDHDSIRVSYDKIYFKQGTNVLAELAIRDERNLEWVNGSWPRYAKLTRSSHSKIFSLRSNLQEEYFQSIRGQKHEVRRPQMELEPLSEEKLNTMIEQDIKTANQNMEPMLKTPAE